MADEYLEGIMNREPRQFSVVGPDLVEFKPSAELRWRLSPTPGERPTLQQKWVAEKTYGDLTYRDEDWRDIPNFEESIIR